MGERPREGGGQGGLRTWREGGGVWAQQPPQDRLSPLIQPRDVDDLSSKLLFLAGLPLSAFGNCGCPPLRDQRRKGMNLLRPAPDRGDDCDISFVWPDRTLASF